MILLTISGAVSAATAQAARTVFGLPPVEGGIVDTPGKLVEPKIEFALGPQSGHATDLLKALPNAASA